MALQKLTRGSHRTADFEKPIYKKRTDFYFGATLAANDEVLLWSADRGGDGNFYAWRGAFPKVVPSGMSPATSGGLGPNAWVSVGDASVGRVYATPMMFGAAGGNADDKLALQRCIDFCQATGAEMRLDRKHKTSGMLTITSAIKITGTLGASAIEGTFAAGDVLRVTVTSGQFNGGLTLNGVEILSSVTKTSGYLINLVGSYNSMIDQVILTNGYNGLGITGPASQTTHVSNLVSANHSNFHIDVQNVSADVVFDSCYLHGQAANNQSVAGCNIRQAGDVTLRTVNTAWCGTDVIITPSSGQRVQALYIQNCFLDTATGYGIYAQPTGTGKIDLLKITDVWCCTHNQGGILLGGSTGTINQADIVNCTVSNNLLNGLFLNIGANNVSVIGGSYSANASSGIAVAANVSKFKIIGVTSGPSGEFGANGQWGIVVNNGAGEDFIITNNNLMGNPLGGLYDGATGPYRQTGGNIPDSGAVKSYAKPATDWDFDAASKGATTIAAGGTLILPAGSGLVMLSDDTDGTGGVFWATAGVVTKIAGDANFVAGPAGASQIGLSYSAGNYRVGNGYPGAKNIYVASVKVKVTS
ncbi:hypothetical protein N7613_00745 [Pseudomonas juntendi]|uniref:tail fiber/spike domain-containing protein n=1 Tax=Pseudomonas juntendi TaxID=2666183 RepID=UPI0018E6A35C|nr:hypothetical protein [Pseudomonas juntendi]MBI6912505.1 hypothetical protein [Pseudomonas juntendi]MDG9807157.1 hypothetical protein [Pseudomonas juntendi]